MKENQLHAYLGIGKEEMKELLDKSPDIPRIELKGTAYYPYSQFMEWFKGFSL